MILKLMDSSDMPDDSSSKGCRILANVQDVKFYHMVTGEAALDAQYSAPNRGLDFETFTLQGNAYLMNDAGKTVQSFSCQPKSEIEQSKPFGSYVEAGLGIFNSDGKILNLTGFSDIPTGSSGRYTAPVFVWR